MNTYNVNCIFIVYFILSLSHPFVYIKKSAGKPLRTLAGYGSSRRVNEAAGSMRFKMLNIPMKCRGTWLSLRFPSFGHLRKNALSRTTNLCIFILLF